MRRFSFLGFVLPVAACQGAAERDCYSDPGACIDPAGSHRGYVVDDVVLPTDDEDAEAMALDLDGDGAVDNRMGSAMATFGIQSEVDLRLRRGDAIVLADLRATSLTDAADAGLWVGNGTDPDPAACSGATCGRHLQGGASFTVDAASPAASLLPGAIAAGVFTGGPGRARIELALSSGGDPLVLDLIGARVVATVSEDGLTDGILAGAIHEDDLETDVLPAVADVLGEVIDAECSGSPPDCCPQGSNGDILLALIDENEDCAITASELSGNSIVSQMLAPDVDLLDGPGAFAPGTDGDNEAISLAFRFTAVTALFTAP